MNYFLSKAIHKILFILLALAVILLTFFSNQPASGIRALFSNAESQYNLFLLGVLAALFLASFMVIWALRRWGYSGKPWVVLFTAYGLPLLAILVSYIWLRFTDAPLIEGNPISSFFRSTWQPFFFFWQVMVLFFSLNRLFPCDAPDNLGLVKRPLVSGELLAAILAGLGSGLVNVYVISVISNQTALSLAVADPPLLLRWMVVVLSLTIAPYALEYFYRRILADALRERFAVSPSELSQGGERRAFWLTAAAFALLTFQPGLWIPAFISGIVYGLLAHVYNVRAAVIAHGITNALILLIGWQWVY